MADPSQACGGGRIGRGQITSKLPALNEPPGR